MAPYIVGISGGSGCGKKQICDLIIKETIDKIPGILPENLIILSMNTFYRDNLTDIHKEKYYNFDHPEAFDDAKLHKTLEALKNNETVTLYRYEHSDCTRKEKIVIDGSKVELILLEGLLALYFDASKNLDLRIFIDVDADVRLMTRIEKDTRELNRDVNDAIENYTRFVKPCFENFCLPSKKYASVIVPRGLNNLIGIDLIKMQIIDTLKYRFNGNTKRSSNISGDMSASKCSA